MKSIDLGKLPPNSIAGRMRLLPNGSIEVPYITMSPTEKPQQHRIVIDRSALAQLEPQPIIPYEPWIRK